MARRSRSRSRPPDGRREPRARDSTYEVPPGQDTQPEVERFLAAQTGIEERAGAQLRSASAEVQRLVLRRGGLQGTRDATAVLISRIRNAQEGLRPVPEADKNSEIVERFLTIECVDPHAASRLRKVSKQVQDSVVARGSLSGTRDPTAVLMSRIRDAEKEVGSGDASQAAATGAAPTASGAEDLYTQLVQQWGEDYAIAYFAQLQQYQQLGIEYGAQAGDVNGLQAQALQAQGVADVNGIAHAQAQALQAQALQAQAQAMAGVNGWPTQVVGLHGLPAQGFAVQQPGGVSQLGVATPLVVGAEALFAGQAMQFGQLGMASMLPPLAAWPGMQFAGGGSPIAVGGQFHVGSPLMALGGQLPCVGSQLSVLGGELASVCGHQLPAIANQLPAASGPSPAV